MAVQAFRDFEAGKVHFQIVEKMLKYRIEVCRFASYYKLYWLFGDCPGCLVDVKAAL